VIGNAPESLLMGSYYIELGTCPAHGSFGTRNVGCCRMRASPVRGDSWTSRRTAQVNFLVVSAESLRCGCRPQTNCG
jgi:hypothetical protein